MEKAENEKAEKLLAELNEHPLTKKLREDKAAEVLAKRREDAGRIAALRNEQAATIPKLQEALEATEAKYAAAKAALGTLADDCREAALALRNERLVSDTTIRNCEASLFESADPEIDAAILFFRDKLDFFRTPGRISRNAVGSEANIITWKKTVKEESNVAAINSAMTYCRAAIATLEKMKLLPAMDAEKIAGLKAGIPKIDVYTEYSGEKPLPGVDADPFAGLPSDSEMKWSIGKLNEKFQKLMGRPF